MTELEILFLGLFIVFLVVNILYRIIIIPKLEVKKDIYDLASKRIKELSIENIKLKNAIKLLEDKLEIFIEYKNGFEEDYYFVKCWQQDMPLTKEKYDLLREVLNNDK